MSDPGKQPSCAAYGSKPTTATVDLSAVAAIRENPGSASGASAANATTAAGAAGAAAVAAAASTTTFPAFFRLDTFGTGVYDRFINAVTILAGTGDQGHGRGGTPVFTGVFEPLARAALYLMDKNGLGTCFGAAFQIFFALRIDFVIRKHEENVRSRKITKGLLARVTPSH